MSTPYPLTPSEQAEVASKAAEVSKRLLAIAGALQRVTWGIEMPTYKDKK